MINPLTASGIIVLAPIFAITVLIYILYRSKHTEQKTKKMMWLVLGFVFLTVFYITAPDPSVIQSLYIDKGDYATPVFWSLVAAMLLFVSIYYFRKHLEH